MSDLKDGEKDLPTKFYVKIGDAISASDAIQTTSTSISIKTDKVKTEISANPNIPNELKQYLESYFKDMSNNVGNIQGDVETIKGTLKVIKDQTKPKTFTEKLRDLLVENTLGTIISIIVLLFLGIIFGTNLL